MRKCVSLLKISENYYIIGNGWDVAPKSAIIRIIAGERQHQQLFLIGCSPCRARPLMASVWRDMGISNSPRGEIQGSARSSG